MAAKEEQDAKQDQKDKLLDDKENSLKERIAKLEALEEEISQKERAIKSRESAKKQIVLRLSPSLWNEIAAWAEEDFRSINGQIEYLLSECVRRRKKGSGE